MPMYGRDKTYDRIYGEMATAYCANEYLQTYTKCMELLSLIETNRIYCSRGEQRRILEYLQETAEWLPDKFEEGYKRYCDNLCKLTKHLKGCRAPIDYRVSRLEEARKDLLQKYTASDNKLQDEIAKLK